MFFCQFTVTCDNEKHKISTLEDFLLKCWLEWCIFLNEFSRATWESLLYLTGGSTSVQLTRSLLPSLRRASFQGTNKRKRQNEKLAFSHKPWLDFQPIWKQLPSEAAHKHQLPGDLHSSAGGQSLPASDKSYRARQMGHALPGRASSKQRGFSCCPWNHLPDEYFCFFLHLQSTAGCTSALQRCKIHIHIFFFSNDSSVD